ncbi:unnamed protein product, partial [Urochloa humidicola]
NPTPYKTRRGDRASSSNSTHRRRNPIAPIALPSYQVFSPAAAMEVVTEAVNNLSISDGGAAAAGGAEAHKKNRIQVSNTKKPLFFYVNLAKRYMQLHNEVELSALGMAIATVVTVAEILKNNGLAVEKKIMTSTVDVKDETRSRPIQKAKIEIFLGKTEKFDELMAAAAEEREAAEAEEQS